MKNKTRSFLLLVCLPVLMLVMLSPAYAITTTIKPSDAINGTSTDAYTATLDPTGGPAGGFYFLNITIPAKYALNLPSSGQTVGNYTMLNTSTGTNKVIINITSNTNLNDYFVNVRYSTDYGATYSTISNQNISNMSIGASTLNITKPTSSTPGYFNLSLGGTAGPISPTTNRVTLTLANGTLTNPTTVGTYTWVLVAKDSPTGTPFTSSNDVRIAAGASNATTFPVFNATIPANASLALPSGNLTVNITAAAGVNVTNLVVTLRHFTSDPGTPTTGASGLERLMFIGVDAPALSGVSFTALLRVNYSSVLSSLTTPEANLRLYRFNDTSNAWEITSNSGVDTSNTTVYGTVSAFSTFAIMGTAAAAAGGGDGGGVTGGGGVVTSEPYTNIEKAERTDKNLIANTPVTYAFKAPELGVYEIAVTGKESENDIAVRVEALKGATKLAAVSPPGTVYKNVNIWAGTKRIKEALIRFKVENSWIGSNSFATSDVKMVKWDGSKWAQIDTSEKTKDATYTYYEAKTDSFSAFAITGLKGVVVPTATPAVGVTEAVTPIETTPAAVPTEKKVPGFEAAVTILAITLLAGSLIRGRKRR